MIRQRRGFTLIELMVVVVIISLLAAIAIPQFSSTKGKARSAALKSDLRNLATAEEGYFYSNSIYTTDTTALQAKFSPGTQLAFTAATVGGWSATVTNPTANPATCALFMGNVPPAAPATVEGSIACQ